MVECRFSQRRRKVEFGAESAIWLGGAEKYADSLPPPHTHCSPIREAVKKWFPMLSTALFLNLVI